MSHRQQTLLLFAAMGGVLVLASLIGWLLKRFGARAAPHAVIDNLNARIQGWWVMVAVVGLAFALGLSQHNADAAFDAAGNFVVVWASFQQNGSTQGVFGQRFDGAGTKLGPAFQVNTYTTSYQDYPAVAADAQGNFVVVWESYGPGHGRRPQPRDLRPALRCGREPLGRRVPCEHRDPRQPGLSLCGGGAERSLHGGLGEQRS